MQDRGNPTLGPWHVHCPVKRGIGVALMTNTARLLLVASVSMIAVLSGGSAFALPHQSHDYKSGKSDWSNGYSNDKWDDDWGDKKKDSDGDKYAKHDWESTS